MAATVATVVAGGGVLVQHRVAAAGGCVRMPLRSQPNALAWVGGRIAVAGAKSRTVDLVEPDACRWVGRPIALPKRAPVVPSGLQPGWVWGPDTPNALAADRSRLWVAGQFSLYRADVRRRRIVRTLRLFRREVRNGRSYRVPIGFLGLALYGRSLWAANLIEGPTFLYRFDATTGKRQPKRRADTEIVGMAAGAARVWAISHDRGTLLRIDPRSARFTRTGLGGEPHGVAFGAGFVWVAMYHAGKILRIDPATGRIAGGPISVPFPPEPMAAAGRRLWAIPSTGGFLNDPRSTQSWRSTPGAARSSTRIARKAVRARWWPEATRRGWRLRARTSSPA